MSKSITFLVGGVSRTTKEFEELASQVDRLKKHGEVVMSLSNLVGPTRSDVPPGGSPWHDYTSWLPSLEKLFPHPDLLPFVDKEHLKQNQAHFRECVQIMRKHKMNA